MKIAAVQTSPVFGQVKQNVNAALALMESVEADLYVLPELFNTGYNFINAGEARSLAENAPGLTFTSVADFAKKKSCYVAYGFVEGADKVYNSSLLVGPSGLVGMYRKVHL